MRLQTGEDRSVPVGEKNSVVGEFPRNANLSNGMVGFANCTGLV